MTSDFTPLPHIDEGEYIATLTRCFKAPPRFGRTDLVMEFEVQTDDFELVLVNAYFQVKWIDSKTFNAGPKSRYFRTYQTCFGKASSITFELTDFPEGEYRLEVTNVERDGRWQALDPVNQYSKVGKIKGRVNND